MHTFVMYCKTYFGDFDRFSKLVETFLRYNHDGIFLYVSVPESELNLFERFRCEKILVISDESFAKEYFANTGHHGMSLGYANQQICKLTFYKTGVTNNYLCLDADTIFIRDFYLSDFMHDENTPYTVLVMDKDLSIERHYRSVHWVGRQGAIKKIYDCMGLDDRRLRTCHGSQILNIKILESLAEEFMRPRGLRYNDLLEISPYEFTWYNVWFQKTEIVKEFVVEPFFKILHMRQEYMFSRAKLLRIDDYAKAYVGLVLNSKWRPKTPINYEDPNIFYRFIYKMITGEYFILKLYFKLARKDILSVVCGRIFGSKS